MRPIGQQAFRTGVQPLVTQIDQAIQRCLVGHMAGFGQHAPRRLQLLPLSRQRRLAQREAVIATHRVGDLRQVAAPRRRHDGVAPGGGFYRNDRQAPGTHRQTTFLQCRQQALIQRRHAVVIETRCLRTKHRHVFRVQVPLLAVALHLFCHVTQRILCALAVELVDGDEVGEVEHVDLFQLRGGAEFRRHHIQAEVDMFHDGGVALADAGGFDDHQIHASDLAGGDYIRQRLGNLGAGVARGQRAHEHAAATHGVVGIARHGPRLDCVHADTVAQQGAARLAT